MSNEIGKSQGYLPTHLPDTVTSKKFNEPSMLHITREKGMQNKEDDVDHTLITYQNFFQYYKKFKTVRIKFMQTIKSEICGLRTIFKWTAN
jgi:hypothetical protein